MMLQLGVRNSLLVSAAAILGSLAAEAAARQQAEVVPVPSGMVVQEEGHVIHEACCEETCGHCGPAIHHKYRIAARRALKCQGAVEVCMHVVNPACCGCPVEIPMCIPVCCTEPPQMTSHCGILGRGIVCLDWPCCGYSARVVFKAHGKVDVIYTAK